MDLERPEWVEGPDLYYQWVGYVMGKLHLAKAATTGPWTVHSSEDTWVLRGGLEQEWQILKAPKRGTVYAEYWPNWADTQFIIGHGPDKAILRHQSALQTLRRHGPGEKLGFELCGTCRETWPCVDVLELMSGYGL